ncbi:hypothetical protein Glove_158g2 [Diversispora epigaea]|uniref:Uncharacterized protein n=1 Tax=Diversispora epigaea TaxID=1348612 RepID=A0A397IRW0_9GLOM|nr:hypothetical protein Glove_158g2 [Diversispora epigaea]
MVRKRSLASVLYEDDTSSDRNRNSRNRSISNILGEESTSNQPSSSSRLILCNCPKCNGRLIDPRTKVIHDLSNESSEISIESFQNRQEIEESERIDEYSSSKSTTLTQDVNLLEIEKDDIPNLTFLPRIRPKRHTNQPISVEISNIITDDEVLNISSEDEMEEMEEISIESEEESADEFSNIFEDYSSPNYDPDEPIDPKSTNNNSYLWILLWIMSFRIKFNLPETATESLIKFIKLLLSEIGNSEFDTFPNSIYMTKKELGLRDDFYSFPTCPKCHKLYNKQEVEDYKENDTNSIMKCRHVEFPNSATRRNRQCQTILFEQVPTMNRFKLKFNHRQIEPELMRRLINDNRINEMIYTENNTKGLEILNTRQSVGSLSEMNQFGYDEMRRFWIYSRTIQESTISGKEPFPGEMLKPFSENIPLSADGILDLMIAYYNDTYENLKFRKPFETDSLNSIIIPLKINKYCRCRIGSEIFGSTFSPRHQKSSYILAKFASEDDSIDIYPGQIQFFFVHEISTNRINMENHYLAYPFETDSLNSIIIPLKINKYCRCRIGFEIFGLTFSPRHQKSSYILAKFASEDDSIDIYPGQIQFFFVHEISTNRINMENHYLAYVRWYKKIKNRFYFSVNKEQICNVELWDTEFYPKSRDCIIPVHHILGRFVPVKYKISDRKNAKEYLAVNPINRKYNLR